MHSFAADWKSILKLFRILLRKGHLGEKGKDMMGEMPRLTLTRAQGNLYWIGWKEEMRQLETAGSTRGLKSSGDKPVIGGSEWKVGRKHKFLEDCLLGGWGGKFYFSIAAKSNVAVGSQVRNRMTLSLCWGASKAFFLTIRLSLSPVSQPTPMPIPVIAGENQQVSAWDCRGNTLLRAGSGSWSKGGEARQEPDFNPVTGFLAKCHSPSFVHQEVTLSSHSM